MYCYNINTEELTDYEYRVGIWISTIAVIAYGLLVLVGECIAV